MADCGVYIIPIPQWVQDEWAAEIEHGKRACWLCGGEKRVEWTGTDDDGNVFDGVYDPCPACEDGKPCTP